MHTSREKTALRSWWPALMVALVRTRLESTRHPRSQRATYVGRFVALGLVASLALSASETATTPSPSARDARSSPGLYSPHVELATFVERAPGAPVTVRFLELRNDIVLLEIEGPYDRELPDGSTNFAARSAVSRAVLSEIGDRYDFLVTFADFDVSLGAFGGLPIGGLFTTVANDVEGIGLPIFDNSDEFGSDGRLQGFVDMAGLDTHVMDPLQSGFTRTLSVLSHEVMHRWSARLRFLDDAGQPSDALLGVGSHWGPLTDAGGGTLMYGNDWRSDGGGQFTSLLPRSAYNPLDLYAAGLVPASEVPDVFYIDNGDAPAPEPPRAGKVVVGSRVDVSIADIVAAEGARVPSYGDAPSEFRAAFVVLTRPGSRPTDAELEGVERVREAFERHFSVLTGGRGILRVAPPATADLEPGDPSVPGGGDLRPEASLPAAHAWLRGQQSADGSFADHPSTAVRDTAEALAVLVAQDPAFSGSAAAAGFLRSVSAAGTDSLARRLQALGSNAELQGELLARRNADGGWGLGDDHRSEPLDTALAVLALRGQAPGLESAGDFLLASETPGGGWSNTVGGAARIGATRAVVEALHAMGRTSGDGADSISAALGWLASTAHPGGGFGAPLASLHETADAVATFQLLGDGSVDLSAATGWLAARQSQAGDWGSSIYTTAVVADVLARAEFSNLAFAGPAEVAPNPARDGEGVVVTATIINNGSVDAMASRAVLRLAGEVLESVDVPTLRPRQTAKLEVAWDTTGRSGTHVLTLELDVDGAVEELSESDNTADVEIRIEGAATEADLELRSDEVVVSPERPGELPAEITVNVIARNIGSTDAPDVALRLWRGDPGAGELLAEETLGVLAARSSVPVAFAFTLDTPGVTELTVEIDPADLVSEASEDNNIARTLVSTVDAVNLVVAVADVRLEGQPLVGERVEFVATVYNRGTVDADNVEVLYQLDVGQFLALGGPTPIQLPAGGSLEVRSDWVVDREGDLAFVIALDPGDLLPEADESDNTARFEFTAGAITETNLQVDPAGLTVSPEPVLEGGSVVLEIVVENNGGTAANDVLVGLFDGLPAEGGLELARTVLTGTLGPGESRVASAQILDFEGSADRVLFAIVDPDGVVPEFDEDDNLALRQVAVLSLPDLALSAGSLRLTPSLPTPGNTVTLEVTVSNLGEQPSGEVSVEVFSGSPSGAVLAAGTVSAPGQMAGVVSLDWVWPQAGADNLVVVVDRANTLRESSEDNNRQDLRVTTGEGSALVTERWFSPNGDGVKDTTAFIYRLDTAADTDVEIVDLRDEVLRVEQGTRSSRDGRFDWDGRDRFGSLVPDGTYSFQAVDSSGAVLRLAEVTVDTNRSPLFAAAGTEFAQSLNLTCELESARDFRVTEDERFVFFVGTGAAGHGMWRVRTDGSSPEPIETGIFSPRELELRNDGAVAYRPFNSNIRFADPLGGFVLEIPDSSGFELLGFSPGTDTPFALSDQGVVHLPIDGSAPVEIWSGSARLDPVQRGFAPGGRYVILRAEGEGFDSGSLLVVDLAAGAAVTLESWTDAPFRGPSPPVAAWLPETPVVAVASSVEERLVLRTAGGVEVESYDFPPPPLASELGFSTRVPQGEPPLAALPAGVSFVDVHSNGRYVLVTFDFFEPQNQSCERVDYTASLDRQTGAWEPVASTIPFDTCGSFHVAPAAGGGELGALHFSPELHTQSLPVDAFARAMRSKGQDLSFEIEQRGGIAAGLEEVYLQVGGSRVWPREILLGGQPLETVPGRPVGVELGFDAHSRSLKVDFAAADVFGDSPRAGRLPEVSLTLVASEVTPRSEHGTIERSSGSAGLLSIVQAQHELFSIKRFDDLRWVPGRRDVFFGQFGNAIGVEGVQLDEDEVVRFLLEFDRVIDPTLSPTGTGVFFRSDQANEDRDENPGANDCVGDPWDDDLYRYRSLLNLTADLRARSDPSGAVLLEGTAADAHFERYLLEFAPLSSPDSWSLFNAPGSEAVVDGQLGVFSPENGGAYLVRLTVEDRAGNTRRDIRQVGIPTTPTIANPELSERVISPNNDGAFDDLEIRFDVVRPVVLDILIAHEGGAPVRALQRTFAGAANDQAVVWDGRDDRGLPVPDGRYVLSLLTFEFFFEVDTTPPTVEEFVLLASPSRAQAPLVLSPSSSALTMSMSAKAQDDHFDELGGEFQIGPPWEGRGTLKTSFKHPTVATGAVQIEPARAVGGSGRVVLTDIVANETVVTEQWEERAFLTAVGPAGPGPEGGSQPVRLLHAGAVLGNYCAETRSLCPLTTPGEAIRLRVDEAIVAPVSQVILRAQHLDENATVLETSLADIYAPGSLIPSAVAPDGAFEVEWDWSGVDRSRSLEVHLEVIDTQGNSFETLPIWFAPPFAGLRFVGQLSEPSAEVIMAIEQVGLDPASESLLHAEETFPGVMSDVRLLVQSDDDSRYVSETAFDVVAQTESDLIFDVPTVSCATYKVRVIATSPQFVHPSTGELVLSETVEVTGELRRPCLEVLVEQRDVAYGSCGGGASSLGEWPISVRATSLDGEPLKRLTLERPLADGGFEVVASLNEPTSGEVLAFDLDTSGLPEGQQLWVARLTNDQDREATRLFSVLVDRTPPELEVTFPLESQRICGAFVPEVRIVDSVGFVFRTTRGGPALGSGPLPSPASRDFSTGVFGQAMDHFPGEPLPFADDVFTGTGALDFTVEAVNAAGQRRCVERRVFVDSEVEGSAITSVDRGFSPNQDLFLDEALIRLETTEPVHADVGVWPRSEVCSGPDPSWPATPATRLLAESFPMDVGGALMRWDGGDANGQVAADGLYAVVARFEDACGNLRVSRHCGLLLDTTPPVPEIDYPLSGDPLTVLTEVTGSVRGEPRSENYESAELAFGFGPAPESWAPIAQFDGDDLRRALSEEVPHYLGTWNLADLFGAMTLRLRTRDIYGNQAEVTTTHTVDFPLVLITELDAAPRLFSPGDDGRRDQTAVRFALSQEAEVTLRVLDANGSLRRTLRAGELFPAGASVVPWDGRDDSNAVLADGEYSLELTAAFGAASQTELVTVQTDSTPPTLVFHRPVDRGFAPPEGPLLVTVGDALLSDWSFELSSDGGSSWVPVASGVAPVDEAEVARLGGEMPLTEGEYHLRGRASDRAENASEQLIAFAIDETPPVVSIDSPVRDPEAPANSPQALLSPVSGPVAILGSVVEVNLDNWRLEYGAHGPAGPPQSFTALASSSELPSSDLLANWSLAGLADGLYTLRLVAVDLAGQEAADTILVAVDATPPTVALDAPIDGAQIGQPVDTVGTASDDNLSVWLLELAPGTPESATRWSVIAQDGESVTGALLHRFANLPPDGVYALRLRGLDHAGNSAETVHSITVDLTPPAAPRALVVTVEGERDARLAWEANTESDLAGYYVYRDGTRISASLVPPQALPTYLDLALADGDYGYRVTAVDFGGLESEPSNEARLTLDRKPPTVRLLAPEDGDRVRGLVEIEGSAHSPSDFFEYRLFVEPTGQPAQRTLLRQSPAPVVLDLLGEWSSFGQPEGAPYTFTLEAVDQVGNLASVSVDVVVDNVAPAQPSGLVAEAVANRDIAVTWASNSEPDLAGYLLYRDGRLVNASGAVVGDLAPFILENTQWTDAESPDGTFEYIVYAIDTAGNLSLPSAPSEATIERRAPSARIVDPEEGTRFTGILVLTATSDDTDLASVRFEVDLGGFVLVSLDEEAPFEATWDPEGRSFGTYSFRAVGTDSGGRVDPAPPVSTFEYADLTPPDGASGLVAQATARDVQLAWNAATDSDLVGYRLERRRADQSSWTEVTTDLIVETTYLDASLSRGLWIYRVAAVDDFDNIGEWSDPAEARVFSVFWSAFPASPHPETTLQELPGRVVLGSGDDFPEAGFTIELRVEGPGGVFAELETVSTPRNFLFEDIPLVEGQLQLIATATDAEGNISSAAELSLLADLPPAPPTGLVTSVSGFDVTLDWDAHPETDVVGFRLFRNGEPVLANVEVRDFAEIDATSTDATSDATFAFDDDPLTFWSPRATSSFLELEALMTAPRHVQEMRIDWRTEEPSGLVHNAPDWNLEVLVFDRWRVVAEVRGDESASTTITLPHLYKADGVRLDILTRRSEEGVIVVPQVAEFRTFEAPLVGGPPVVDTAPDGLHTYTVTAVDVFGFESVLSAPAAASVGDVVAPSPPSLVAVVVESSVQLSWTASPEPDVVAYAVERDGARIARHEDLSSLELVDGLLANGIYSYLVRALDAAGNASASSNVEVVEILAPSPLAPVALQVLAVRADAVDLAWQPPAGPPPAGYVVRRSAVSGGPYERVASTPAPPFTDRDLETGMQWFWVVTSIDAVGNESSVSNEVAATPIDAEPPAVPTILVPVRGGETYQTSSTPVPVGGRAEPGTGVRLERDDLLVAVGTATGAPVQHPSVTVFGSVVLAPWSARIVFEGSGEVVVRDVRTGIETKHPTEGDNSPIWLPDEEGFLYVGLDGIRRFLFDGARDESLTTARSGNLSLSPDGTLLALSGRRTVASGGTVTGIHIYDLTTGEWFVLAEGSTLVGERLRWSRDSAWFAWAGRSSDPGLFIWERATGSSGPVVRIEDTVSEVPVKWDAAGRVLVSRPHPSAPSEDQMVRITPSTGVVEDLGLGRLPVVSPDGSELAFVDPQSRIVVRDLSSGEEDVVDVSSARDLQFGPSGLLGSTGASHFFLDLPGRFQFPVALEPGSNLVRAIAVDSAGNPSAPSEAVNLVLEASQLPDLALEGGVSLLPVQPASGDTVRVGAAVKNRGGSVSQAATRFVLAVDLPDGAGGLVTSTLVDADVPPLAPGERLEFSADFEALAGVHIVRAVVDAANVIFESDETNNRSERSVDVPELAGPALTVELERDVWQAGDLVTGSARLSNAGDPLLGTLVVRVEDEAGFALATLSRVENLNLDFGASHIEEFLWDSAGVFAGTYVVVAELFDASLENGAPPVLVDRATLGLGAEAEVTAAIQTDRGRYTPPDEVEITASVSHLTTSAIVEDAISTVRVFDPNDVEVAMFERDHGTLLPGEERTALFAWSTDGALPGVWRVVHVLRGAGIDLATAETTFEVSLQPAALVGSLFGPSSAVAVGDTLPLDFTVRNVGGVDLAAIPVRVVLRRAESGEELGAVVELYDLAVQETISGRAEFATDGLELASYVAVLSADLPAPGGGVETVRLATIQVSLVDRQPPVLEFRSPATDGAFLAADARLVVAATDDLSGIERVEIAIDGGPFMLATLADIERGEFVLNASGLSEGTHTTTARATDRFGNVATAGPLTFEVDLTPPLITILGVIDGQQLTGTVTPVVQILEDHLAASSVLLNGLVFISGTDVSQPGSYLLQATARDLAGNQASTLVRFVILGDGPSVTLALDAEEGAPGVVVSGSATVSAASTALDGQLAVRVYDSAGSLVAVLVDGTAQVPADGSAEFPFTWDTAGVAPGVYTVRAVLTDGAGTVVSESAEVFTILVPQSVGLSVLADPANAEVGTEIAVRAQIDLQAGSEPLSGARLDLRIVEMATATVVASWQDNPADIPVGQSVVVERLWDSSGAAPGQYRVEADLFLVTELLANADSALQLGGTNEPPVVAIVEPLADALLPASFTVRVSATDDNSVDTVEIRMDGGAWLPATAMVAPFYERQVDGLADGLHQIEARATDGDGAEGRAQAISVEVDGTPPEITVTGVEHTVEYEHPVTPIITVEDPHLDTTEITLDFQPFESGTEVDANGAHFLVVVATDTLGNTARVEVRFILKIRPSFGFLILDPEDGESLLGPHEDVSGQADPGATVEVTATRVAHPHNSRVYPSVIAEADGSWLVPKVKLFRGLTRIDAVATTAGGEVLEDSITVEWLRPKLKAFLDRCFEEDRQLDRLFDHGDVLVWTLRVENVGDAAARGVTALVDVPSVLKTVPGSVQFGDGSPPEGCTSSRDASGPELEALHAFGGIEPGGARWLRFATRLAEAPLPGTRFVAIQGVLTAGDLEPTYSDDPTTVEKGDATVVDLSPSVIAIPVLGPFGLFLLVGLLLAFGVRRLGAGGRRAVGPDDGSTGGGL